VKLHNIQEVDSFKKTVNECKGDVFLSSVYGDRYNLKSLLSQYTAISLLLSERGNELELWCPNKQDEQLFNKFFIENSDVLSA
jgi:hypothetical protein